MKTAIPTILVLLGACDRTASDTHPAPAAAAAAASVDARFAAPAAVNAPPVLVQAAGKGRYVCPMHPEVVSDQPGLCPKCNMKLEPESKAAEVRSADERAPSGR